MATRTFAASKSSLFGVTGSTELGGGQDQHLPVGGPWNGYTFRGAVQFALDFSTVRRITGATLYMKTTGQVHVGFASGYCQVERATGSWTANGASSSGEGGSGWSTSPTVYPGPPSTTTGASSKSVSSSEGVWFYIDVTAIVRAWASAAVEGGGGAANYGVVLHYAGRSGSRTEFYSYEAASGNRPYIVISYDTDAPPPAPTVTAPTGTTTSLRPVSTATCVDPDGDPLQAADVEYRKAGTVVHSNVGFVTGVSATAITYTPTADLPAGDLTVRFRAMAAGVYGAWSAEAPFTIDRPPVVTAFTAPPATVSGNLRPPITWTTTDADADAVDLWDLRVYPDVGGGVPGDQAVYYLNSQATGITGTAGAQTVTNTPTVNLPPGPLLARSRVRSRGVWSAWSAYYPFTIVVAVPAVTILTPPTDGGYIVPTWVAPPTAIDARGLQFSADIRPPSGTTLTKVHHRLLRLPVSTADPGDTLDAIGSFEDPSGAIPGWTPTVMGSGGNVSSVASSTVGDGSRALQVVGDGATVSAGALTGLVAATKGATYTLKAFGCRVKNAATGAIVRLETLPADRATATVVQTLTFVNASPMVSQQVNYTVPGDGSVAWLRVRVMYTGVLPLADEYRVDAVTLTGPRSGWYVEDVDVANIPAGGVFSRSFTPPAMGFPGLYGTFQSEWTATASNAGVTGPVIRRGRFSIGEWQGAVFLGDQAAALAIPVELAKADRVSVYYRAQSSPTAANGAAPWRTRAEVATIQGELPPANAYLGVDVRMARLADDSELLTNGSFEDGVGSSPIPGWTIITPVPGGTGAFADATAIDGSRLVRLQGAGAGNAEISHWALVPVIPGATYRLTAYGSNFTGANNARIRVDARRADQSAVAFGVINLVWANRPPLVVQTGVYTVPADGSVAYLGVVLGFVTAVAQSTEVGKFDAVSLTGPAVGDGGMDKLGLTWTSLG